MSQQNNIEIVSAVFAVGESRIFALSGNYFEIIDAPNPVDVVLSGVSGARSALMRQAGASFYSKNVDFAVIQITSANNQTIRFAYGSGEIGTRRATGSVSISGSVELGGATLSALEQITVRPETQTGNFTSMFLSPANSADTVFTPASNLNGALILSASMHEIGNSVSTIAQGGLFAKNAAPLNAADGALIMPLLTRQYVSGTTFVSGGDLNIPQFIAPGLGVYFFSNQTVLASQRACRYRLL